MSDERKETNLTKNQKHDIEINEVWDQYQNAKTYLMEAGLYEKIPEFTRFYEGDQWPKPTKRTAHMPRPIFNFIEMIVNHKVANVGGTPLKLNFVAPNDTVASSKFTRFVHYQMKELRQSELDARALINGAVKGTYIYHYYWDESVASNRGKYEGGVRGQVLDPLNVFFANPRETDEQKQEWIIIESRESVKAVKEMADKDVNKDLIVGDELESPYKEIEQKGDELCTLLLKYFRKDGEVYFTRATKNVIVNKPTPLNPYLTEKLMRTKEDSEIATQPDNELEKEDGVEDMKFHLYPISVGSWKPKDKSIYGRGEVETMIPNQKAINFEIAMQLLNHQELGWGKILVKHDALRGQEITNTPGEVLIDHTPGNNWGITRLEGQGFSAGALNFAPQILELTRTVTNSTEVVTGEMISKDLSGRAIAQLQAEGKKSTAFLQKSFMKNYEKIGLILQQFNIFYYDETEFSYELDIDELTQLEEEQLANGITEPIETTRNDIFNGKEFKDTKFNIVVEAGAGTEYSELMAMEMLNTLFLNGNIQRMTTEQLELFITLYPDSAIPFKQEFRQIIKRQQRSELGQLKQLAQEQEQQILQQQEYIQQLEQAVKNLDGELKRSNQITMQLQQEYTEKLNYLLGRTQGQAPVVPNINPGNTGQL